MMWGTVSGGQAEKFLMVTTGNDLQGSISELEQLDSPQGKSLNFVIAQVQV